MSGLTSGTQPTRSGRAGPRRGAAIIRLIGKALVRSIYRIRVADAGRLPASGGALLLPNHVTFADAFFISVACPRPVRFVMDEVFLAKRSIRWFTGIFDTVTIRRDQPREAIRITIEALKNGDLVCLFPEGQLTRTGTLCELRRGFELIARKAGHPLIPMWCDGSWGSVFSFERGKFFSKLPYRLPYPVTVAFGKEIAPGEADLETVQRALLGCSAAAVAKRFDSLAWGKRVPKSGGSAAGEFTRRRQWINGYQIGQINALQRRREFFTLKGDPTPAGLPGLMLCFTELFDSPARHPEMVDGGHARSWVGGDRLRDVLGSTQLSREIVFYDFGTRALEPVYRAGLVHCACLALDGMVVAMSMPDPPVPTDDSDVQKGRKPGTWGKLLPGWLPWTGSDGVARVFGPAAPDEGLPLPEGSFLDAEGFLTAKVKPGKR